MGNSALVSRSACLRLAASFVLTSSLIACEGWHIASLGPATSLPATLDKESVTRLGASVTILDSEHLVVIALRASGWNVRPTLLFNSASSDSTPMEACTHYLAFRERTTRRDDGKSLAFQRNVLPPTATGINPRDRGYFDFYDGRDGPAAMPATAFTDFGNRPPEIHLLLITTRRALADSTLMMALAEIGPQRNARDITDRLAARLKLGAEWAARDYDRP